MCLAIPMRLIEIDGAAGVAEVDGVTRQVRLDLLLPKSSWATTS